MSEEMTLPQGVWRPDPAHSRIGFSAKHMGVATVRGEFREYSGELRVDEDGSTEIWGEISVGSVTTNVDQRDDHLRSEDFFGAEQWPTMRFRSTEIIPVSEDQWTVRGDLTIRDQTHPIELEAEIGGVGEGLEGETRLGAELRGELSRKQFGMKFNAALGSGNLVVSDRIKLELDISAVLQDPERQPAEEKEVLAAA